MGLVLAIFILAFVFLLGGYRSNLTKIPSEVHAQTIAQRFTDNGDCFAYVDEKTGNVFSGMIDLGKFTDEVLQTCYQPDQSTGFAQYNFRLLLQSSEVELKTNNYFNKDDFTLYHEVIVIDAQQHISKDMLLIYVQEKI